MGAREEPPTIRVRAVLPSDPGTLLLVVGGRIAPSDIPGLCERARVLLECSEVELVVCDVGALREPDAATVEALARLQLTARRLGRRVRLRDACDELRDLIALTGLADAVPLVRLPPKPGGQAEQREQPLGVEEEGEPADPTARELDDLE